MVSQPGQWPIPLGSGNSMVNR